MTFAPLSNWRYDKSLYHNIQSGPQRTGSALNLTDTYILTSSGYVYASGQQQTYVALSTPGADYGTITPGPPQSFAADVGLATETYPETKTFEVTVVSDGGNKFALDNVSQKSLTLYQGSTYIFDLSSTTTSAHPFRLSETYTGTWASGVAFTDGVTTSGVQGNPGAYLQIIVPSGLTSPLFPYCTVHSGMGGTATYSISGPPVNRPIFNSTNWRHVPPAISGYWTNYENTYPHASGLLTVYDGYRRQASISTANSTVQTAFGPEPGLKDRGPFIYYGNNVPDQQQYLPFETGGTAPDGGSTGGGMSYPLAQYPTLIRTNSSGTASRAEWQYYPPSYCESRVESVRSQALPGDTADGKNVVIRSSYRGKSSRYVPNYGSTYGVPGEGIRGMIRTFSPGVNSSNQKNQ
jgi:hypothetical protein